jgi:RHS repeat-associated protein
LGHRATQKKIEHHFKIFTEATLTMGTGPDHSIYDVYIGGSLWQSFDGYAAAAGQRNIVVTTGIDGRKLSGEGPHIVEIRNRAERHRLSTGFKLRFKQLLVVDRTYTLQTIRYSYDALSRLTEARTASGVNALASDANLLRREQFAFDRAGNRTQQSIALNGAAPTVTNYTYNAGNQLTSDGTTSYTYDNNGNLATYTWDRANRLLSMGGSTYAYDGTGNRIRQTVGANVTRYLLDLQPGLAVVLAATTGASTDRYVHGQRGIHAQQLNGGAWQHTLQDGLGSVRVVADNNLATLNAANYSAYGTPDAAIGSPFAFTGEQRDASGLQYHRARYYAPGLGVFASLDVLENLNRYSYALGNPANWIDPTGLQTTLTSPWPGDGGWGGGSAVGGAAVSGQTANQIGEGIIAALATLFLGSLVVSPPTDETAPSTYTPQPWVDYTPAPATTPDYIYPMSTAADAGVMQPGYPGLDPDELWRALAGACGATLLWLLTRLGIRPIDRTQDRNENDNCDRGLTPQQAARHYARIASYVYYQGAAQFDRNLNPPITVAVTRAKNRLGVCTEYVAVSNATGRNFVYRSGHPLEGELNELGIRAVEAQASVARIANGRNATSLGVTNALVTYQFGVQGHAETNLITGIVALGRLDTMRAIGVSQAPCPDCAMFLRMLPFRVAFHSNRIGQTVDFQ